MIWVGGRVVADDALAVSALDRTFEHGLGLFETLRTWEGRAPLLGRHLSRLARSANQLGLPYASVLPPDAGAVSALIEAEGLGGDVMLRVTLTGGLDENSGATLWMRALPLPLPMGPEGAVVSVGAWSVDEQDPMARHKSLNYWSRRHAFQVAQRLGFHETLSGTRDGKLWEGSRTNLFVLRGNALHTPSLDGPIVPGVMRALVIESACDLPLTVDEDAEVTGSLLGEADEVFLTNSVRGVLPVVRIGEATWPAPGDWTRRLQKLLVDRVSARDPED